MLVSGVYAGQGFPEPLPCPLCGGWMEVLAEVGRWRCRYCRFMDFVEAGPGFGPASTSGAAQGRPLGVLGYVGPRTWVDRFGQVVIKRDGRW